MTHLDFADISGMSIDTLIRLHWQGEPTEALLTTVAGVLGSIEAGEFTESDFDEHGYCVTDEDYRAEQALYY